MLEKIEFHIIYKWKYLLSYIKNLSYVKNIRNKTKSIVYVAAEVDKDWIFGAKVRRLSKFSNLSSSTYFHNLSKHIPTSDGYFYVHPKYFCRAFRKSPHILKGKNIVMFTHENWDKYWTKTHVIWCLNRADKVIFLNTEIRNKIVKEGLKKEKTHVLHIASDPDFFYHHKRENNVVGFCCAYYERKNPDLIFNLVKNMPERDFVLIGKNWNMYEKFDELIKFNNFTYLENQPYEKYPEFYSNINVFVSPSKLEGGPVPLLEAMLSNCFPVASKTGFCPDIILHGENGYLFDIDANYKEVAFLINKAFKNDESVRETVLEHSWENCSEKIDELFLQL